MTKILTRSEKCYVKFQDNSISHTCLFICVIKIRKWSKLLTIGQTTKERYKERNTIKYIKALHMSGVATTDKRTETKTQSE